MEPIRGAFEHKGGNVCLAQRLCERICIFLMNHRTHLQHISREVQGAVGNERQDCGTLRKLKLFRLRRRFSVVLIFSCLLRAVAREEGGSKQAYGNHQQRNQSCLASTTGEMFFSRKLGNCPSVLRFRRGRNDVTF
jgi:hypothetical protein